MPATKIATCCYCGTKAALVLRGASKHELSCSSCGAPLHAMKMLPIAPVQATASSTTPARPGHSKPRKAKVSSEKKRKKRKGFGQRLWEELWDEIEDIFD